MIIRALKSVATALLLLNTCQMNSQTLAFPEAEGFAAYATGGRGGKVVHVTNLNASGAGSLAEAVSVSNRIVVFDVGGVIDITGSAITIASNVTIAGQTAPGGGITIYGGRVIASKSKNVIIRYLRMRGGSSVNEKKCTLTLDECQNLIMDHCSISWGPWDDVHITDANNITWQNCIIAEGIDPQRFGAITDGTRNWTISHCLWIDNKSRNPKMKCYVQYYNNVVYNYAMGVVGGHSAADNYQDLMNNYFIAGPDGSYKYFDQWTETDHLDSSGNYYDGNCDGILNGILITDYNGATAMSSPYLPQTMPMNLESAEQAYYNIVAGVGASIVRDVHDQRYIEQLTSLGTKGAFISSEQDVGGIGTVENGAPLMDTDQDGMPDEWEEQHGLNPNVDDAAKYDFGNGYTNSENYVNTITTPPTIKVMYPTNVKVYLKTATSARLSWENTGSNLKNVIVEQSEDNVVFTQIKKLKAATKITTISGLQEGVIYYFRLKNISKDDEESMYSKVVSVNDEYKKTGGGTKANTNPFIPEVEKSYRIVNYGSEAYSLNTDFTGMPKYMTITTDGQLGSTEKFDWEDDLLLWKITETEGGYHIVNTATGKSFSAANETADEKELTLSTEDTPVFTINYVKNTNPDNGNSIVPFSFYRINSPSFNNYQIQARQFQNEWFWGSGSLSRADMLFTFAPVPVATSTGVGLRTCKMPHSTAYYNLQGMMLNDKPTHGFYIEKNVDGMGNVRTYKKMIRDK